MNPTGNRIYSLLIWILCLGLFSWSCQEPPRPVQATAHIRVTDQGLVEYNRGVIKTEEQEIADFIRRYGWNVSTTPTGLRYLIYHTGTGLRAEPGFAVRFGFDCSLLTGQLLYTSDSSGLKECILGRREVESGLEEGLVMLCEGDRAKFILPSHLAFGLLGDQQKIPPGSTLVYDVEIFKITPAP